MAALQWFRILIASAGALCAGCSSPGAGEADTLSRRQPIIDGVADDADVGVVALVSGGKAYCSGTLISDRVVLTAAHCLSGGLPTVVFGSSIAAPLLETEVVGHRVHHAFDVDSLAHDLGMLVLASSAPEAARPWALRDQPIDSAHLGDTVRIVGFGVTTGPGGNSGVKFQGTATIGVVEANTLTLDPQPAHTCVGDSGGPGFMSAGDREELAAVTSYGDATCTGGGIQVRVDAYAASFIKPYLAATALGAAGPGQRCFYPENCSSGQCHLPASGEAFAYCSDACVTDDECPKGMFCVTREGGASACEHPAPGPGAVGQPCEEAYDCVTGVCARWDPAATRVCTVRCFPENAVPCEGGLECLLNADNQHRYACFEPRVAQPDAGAKPDADVAPPSEAGEAEVIVQGQSQTDSGGCATRTRSTDRSDWLHCALLGMALLLWRHLSRGLPAEQLSRRCAPVKRGVASPGSLPSSARGGQ